MVKIRLKRIGTKGRPFYRVVVAKSTAGRDSAVIETIGTYDPIAQPKVLQVDEERAMHWLLNGAQPTETTAYILNRTGVLPRFLEQRPNQRKVYSYLDKRTAPIAASTEAPTAEPAESAQ